LRKRKPNQQKGGGGEGAEVDKPEAHFSDEDKLTEVVAAFRVFFIFFVN
jgi:hypothetical protein